MAGVCRLSKRSRSTDLSQPTKVSSWVFGRSKNDRLRTVKNRSQTLPNIKIGLSLTPGLDGGFAYVLAKHQTKTKMPNRQVEQAGDSSRQIDAAAARKILGLIGRNYSDLQLEEALECLYMLAEIGHEIMPRSLPSKSRGISPGA